MEDLFEFGKSILESQPFSQWVGAELARFEPGCAEIRLSVEENMKQQHGFVHGGIIGYLTDNCLTFAGGSVLWDCVTSEYKINYVKPAIGHTLISRATVLSSGKRQAVCECKVYLANKDGEVLVAVAQGTIVSLEKK